MSVRQHARPPSESLKGSLGGKIARFVERLSSQDLINCVMAGEDSAPSRAQERDS